MKIKFVLPSKSRPHKFFATLDNVMDNCITDNWKLIAILDLTDSTMNNHDVVERIIRQYPNVKPYFKMTTGKVNAINSAVKHLYKDDVVVLIADDIEFTQKGFDAMILNDMNKYFPKNNGLLHYPDNIPQSGEKQITMPVMGYNLIKELGHIYNPIYESVWCDNHQMAIVKKYQRYKYIPVHFYNHNHPAFSKGETDDLYKHNESFYWKDRETYLEQLKNNFE